MKIEHLALWVKDLEAAKIFYETYFEAQSNELYHNPIKKFKSYFLTFKEGARLEIMEREDVNQQSSTEMLGWAHIAFSVGSKEKVDELTNKLISDGYTCTSQPRLTGDGYYESVIEDPEKNLIEITV